MSSASPTHARHRRTGQVHGKSQQDADHQRVVKDRPPDGAGRDQPSARSVVDDLHRRQPQRVAERRVQRDDRVVRLQGTCAIGAFGDRQAQQHRIREQAGKADGNAVGPGAFEEIPCPKQPRRKARRRPGVEAAQQRRVEILPQVERRDRAEQQAGDREILRELHQPVDARVRKDAPPDGEIAEAHDQEDRKDDLEKGLHLSASARVSEGRASCGGIFAKMRMEPRHHSGSPCRRRRG